MKRITSKDPRKLILANEFKRIVGRRCKLTNWKEGKITITADVHYSLPGRQYAYAGPITLNKESREVETALLLDIDRAVKEKEREEGYRI